MKISKVLARFFTNKLIGRGLGKIMPGAFDSLSTFDKINREIKTS